MFGSPSRPRRWSPCFLQGCGRSSRSSRSNRRRRRPRPEASGTPPIRQNVNLVDVLFTVLNRQNKIVADLNQENFQVFDDDAPQEIRFFSRQTDLPLRVGLLLDTSNSIRERLQFEQEAAIDFLFNVIRRDKDQAFLMTVDDEPEVIQGFHRRSGPAARRHSKQRAGGGTALYDAIYQACAAAAPAAPLAAIAETDVRRVLVVISDGDDNLSRHSRGEALEMAQRAGIVIYTISTSTDWILTDQETSPANTVEPQIREGPRRPGAAAVRGRQRRPRFFPLSRRRSGAVVRAISETNCAASIRWLTFPSGRLADGKFHTIRIEVERQGIAGARAQRLLAPCGRFARRCA